MGFPRAREIKETFLQATEESLDTTSCTAKVTSPAPDDRTPRTTALRARRHSRPTATPALTRTHSWGAHALFDPGPPVLVPDARLVSPFCAWLLGRKNHWRAICGRRGRIPRPSFGDHYCSRQQPVFAGRAKTVRHRKGKKKGQSLAVYAGPAGQRSQAIRVCLFVRP